MISTMRELGNTKLVKVLCKVPVALGPIFLAFL